MNRRQQRIFDEHIEATHHICFVCHRKLEMSDTITSGNIGPMKIYFHTSCAYPEDEAQQMYEKSLISWYITPRRGDKNNG